MNEPITPADRVLPTEADVADALIQHETSGMCRYRRTCGACDCGRSSLNAKGLAEQDAMELGRARAVLALFASQPTVAQVKAEALQGVTYDTAFVRRCATDETYNGELLSARDFDRWLAQVKAEAWGEGYVAACDRYGHELGTYGDRPRPAVLEGSVSADLWRWNRTPTARARAEQ